MPSAMRGPNPFSHLGKYEQERYIFSIAEIAQSVEQRTRNAKVVGSIPIFGTVFTSPASRGMISGKFTRILK